MSFAVLLLLGVGAVGAGSLVALARRTFAAGIWLQAVGCGLIAVGGLWSLAAGEVAGKAFTSSFDPRIGVDGLSGLFLGVLGVCGAAALVFAVRYLEPSGRGRAIASLTGLFVLVQLLVLVARGPADLPPRLGGHDVGACGGDPRRPRR